MSGEADARTSGLGLVMEVLHQLLADITAAGGGSLSDSQLLSLHSVFPQQLQPALELVEQEAVTLYTYTTPSLTRTLWMVQGSTGNQYIILGLCPPSATSTPSPGYCSCPSFVYSVLVRGDAALCKHQLAAHLATATGLCKTEHLSPQQWALKASTDTP